MAMGVRRAFEEITNPQERGAWLQLPITGCDGVPNSGQEWVRQGKLAATVVSPPIAGDAIQLLVSALKAGSQPPERTMVAPRSLPAINELQKVRARAAQESK
jgi:ribose transport system substrate-binding protein